MSDWLNYIVRGMIIGLVLAPGNTLAGSCGRAVCHQPTYFTKEVIQVDPALIAVPVIFFQYFQPVVPVAQTTPVAISPNPPAIQGNQVNQSADLESKIDQIIRLRLEEIIREQVTGSKDDGPPSVPGVPGAVTTNVPQQQDNVGVLAYNILSTRCASCHTGANSKGGVTLFVDKEFKPSVSLTKIIASVEDDSMPKTGSPLAISQKAILRKAFGLQ